MSSIDQTTDGDFQGDRETPDLDAARDAILMEMLPNVPFDGWTLTALRDACEAAGYPPEMAVRAFPGGVIDAIEHFIDMADRHMLTALEAMDLASMRVRDRIGIAIRIRLEQNAPHREAVRRAGAVLALPIYAPIAARSLYRTVDAIWYAAGDRSTDFNFYTKRGLLAGVYSSTLLYWLRDDSPDFAATWAFLDRRIENVMQFGKATGQLSKLAGRLPDPFAPLRAMRGMAEQAREGVAPGMPGTGFAGRRRPGPSPFGTGFNPVADFLTALRGGRRRWTAAHDPYADPARGSGGRAHPGDADADFTPGDAPD